MLPVNKWLCVLKIYSQNGGHGWGSCGGSFMYWPSTCIKKIMAYSPMICKKIQYRIMISCKIILTELYFWLLLVWINYIGRKLHTLWLFLSCRLWQEGNKRGKWSFNMEHLTFIYHGTSNIYDENKIIKWLIHAMG